jgi:hypothetical protein
VSDERYTDSPSDYKPQTNIPRLGVRVSKVAARSTSDNGAILNFWVRISCLHRSYLSM